MVEDAGNKPGAADQSDGYSEALGLLKAHSIDFLGTIEVILSCKEAFEKKYEPRDPKRVAVTSLVTELSAKMIKLGALADKTMTMIYVKEAAHENTNPVDVASGKQSETNL